MENGATGTVVDPLSVQFTAEYDPEFFGGALTFRFYADEGHTWKAA